jgi:hypothetical protein
MDTHGYTQVSMVWTYQQAVDEDTGQMVAMSVQLQDLSSCSGAAALFKFKI